MPYQYTPSSRPATRAAGAALNPLKPSSLAVIGLGAIGGSLAWQARLAGVPRVVGFSPERSEGILSALKASAVTDLADGAQADYCERRWLQWIQRRTGRPRFPTRRRSVLIGHPILAGVYMARILIVEDSPDNMKLFQTILGLKGHEVFSLTGGEGLTDEIQRQSPDLVLMDIQLPGKDGFSLLQEIRESPSPKVRVVALTGSRHDGGRERALESVLDGYITKPMDGTHLS